MVLLVTRLLLFPQKTRYHMSMIIATVMKIMTSHFATSIVTPAIPLMPIMKKTRASIRKITASWIRLTIVHLRYLFFTMHPAPWAAIFARKTALRNQILLLQIGSELCPIPLSLVRAATVTSYPDEWATARVLLTALPDFVNDQSFLLTDSHVISEQSTI
jgi:hypothetical protein